MKTLKHLFILTGAFCISLAGISQDCALSCPDNIIVQARAGQEGTEVNFPAFNAPAGCGTVTFTPASGSFFRLGSHSITVMSSTGQKCSFTVTVTDNEAPTLSAITLSRTLLWPASNKMKKVNVFYTASDNGEDVKTQITVSSNAPASEEPDWQIIDDHLLRLKASRLPDDSPRIYTITVTATDVSGNKTTRTTTIAVSKTMLAVPAK